MKASFDATGEVLIVTGGAHGIGAAAARAYASSGGTAVVFDIAGPEQPDDPVRGVQHRTVDVSDRAAVLSAVASVVADHGRVDALIAAAAMQPRLDVIDTPEDTWKRVLDVNLNGTVWACQAVLASMVPARRGSIIAFASGLALSGMAQASAYAATKGAVVPYVKSLAAEVAQHRVRVNAVFPGVIDTPQFQSANPEGPQRDHWLATTGIGTPDDVVGALLFLLSDAATMTGSVLTRDRAFSKEDD